MTRAPGPTMLAVLDAIERLAGEQGITVMALARATAIPDHQVRAIVDKLERREPVRVSRSAVRVAAPFNIRVRARPHPRRLEPQLAAR